MNLEDLTRMYPTDKCAELGHNYIPGYKHLFEPFRSSVMKVLEIGIGCGPHEEAMRRSHPTFRAGNSLRMWRDYFPRADVYGVDILPVGMIHGEERITTLVADQSSETDMAAVVKAAGGQFDVIIDDGSHQALHQVISFFLLEQHLSENGMYVIEDVQPQYIEAFKSLDIFPSEFRQRVRDVYDISFYDTRTAQGPQDDFLMVFKRKTAKQEPEKPRFTIFQQQPQQEERVFVILRCMKEAEDKELWRRAYTSVRYYYPNTKIVIIDDNTLRLSLEDEKDKETINTEFIKSEFQGAGELLPYYYFHKHKWATSMIFLHDSMFLKRPFKPEELDAQKGVRFFWDFDRHEYDDEKNIGTLLEALNPSTSNFLTVLNGQKDKWHGAFGVAGLITLEAVSLLETKYGFLSRLISVVKTRDARMALERVFGLLCYAEGLVFHENVSMFGHIHDYHGCWQVGFEWQMKNRHLYPSAVMKTWSGR